MWVNYNLYMEFGNPIIRMMIKVNKLLVSDRDVFETNKLANIEIDPF